jgi:crossover junction endodeoxyribonuclease RusA
VTGKENQVADAKDNVNDWKQKETNPLVIDLPFPPSVNHYLGSRGYQRYKTPRAKVFDSEVYAIVLSTKANLNFDVPVAVWYQYWFPDRRRRDIANYEKVLSDSMVTAGVMVDDYLIFDMRQTKMGYCPDGKVRVIITPHVKGFIPA